MADSYNLLYDVIRHRRSIGRVKDTPVPREFIEKMLEAAIWAPSHFKTEPWKFFVITDEARDALGDVLANIYKAELASKEYSEEELRKIEMQRRKPFRAPVIIAVATIPSDKPRVFVEEELAATSAAIQNMLLAAQALGLATMWRTGEATYHPLMKEFFGLGEQDMMNGFIYVGYPDLTPLPGERQPVHQKTVWMNTRLETSED